MGQYWDSINGIYIKRSQEDIQVLDTAPGGCSLFSVYRAPDTYVINIYY